MSKRKQGATPVATAPVVAPVVLSQAEILAKLASKEITVEQATEMLRDTSSPKNSKPRIVEKGKIQIMPGFSVTAYQATKFLQHADEIRKLIGEQLTGRDAETTEEGRDKKEFKKFFRGTLLMGYQKDHVAVVSEFFRK